MKTERLTKENLLDRVATEPNTGCWFWVRYAKKVTPNYFMPRVSYNNKSLAVTRVVWSLFNGDIPANKHVCHICDISLCVNPDHLYLTDHNGNMEDLKRRGRGKSAVQKMDAYDVIKAKEMRNSGLKVVEIAKFFGVNPKSMSRILNGGRWSALQVTGG